MRRLTTSGLGRGGEVSVGEVLIRVRCVFFFFPPFFGVEDTGREIF